ncbi:MAG: hydrogenase nickel incorporation protein HypB [Candidatus Aureabacteria bacterium]|nr:hydrogenase nickel incorporation protein HypB [Candidatus Auribacterota bacterium]
MKIKMRERVLSSNDAWARENKAFLTERNIRMLNLIGSPGAGKTCLLEKTIDLLGERIALGIIEGDLATAKDADRIRKKGVPVYQINTGSGCHLNARSVHKAMRELCTDTPINLIVVENVGNLVCPAEFDLGEDAKVAVLSVTEGDDKVEKYPLLFTKVSVLLITKMALLRHTNFNLTTVRKAFRKLNRMAPLFSMDSLSGRGFSPWMEYLNAAVQREDSK